MNQYVWARSTFRSLLADHDLLLVDNRGTGALEPIDCPKAGPDFSGAAVTQCRAVLGARADDYATVAAVDDLDAVLTRLHADDVDMYGESYGTFFAQLFALRHPQHLARLVLDGALPLNVDPWRLDAIPTALAGLQTVCRADATCRSSDPVALLRKVLARVRVGIPPNRVSARAAGLASLLQEAGRGGTAYRELPAALRAYLAGDPLPLDRLKNEALAGGASAGGADPTSNSGLFLADTCADFPQPFDLHASAAAQWRQLKAARKHVATTSSRKIAPFAAGEALRGQELCLGWPAPKNPTPQSQHQKLPNTSTLVLEGALDTITPPPGARHVANEFRNGRYIQVPFVGHITARKDLSGCAARIAATFLASKPIHTDCLARISRPLQVESFPTTFAQETPITPIDAHGATDIPANDLRTVAIARDVISDVMWRWGPLGFYSRHGLRGGSFTTIAPLHPGDYSVHLNKIRWTTDTTVTGDLVTSPTAYTLVGFVVVSSPAGRTQLEIQSPHILPPSTEETISGTFGGLELDVTVDANLGL
jgi:pimeloyl-ACP methyl ester carboxylesterase